jgi:KRAB domain-containing zinc finger protein
LCALSVKRYSRSQLPVVNMKVHMKIHTGDTLYVYTVYSKKTFLQASTGSLKVHIRNHTGEKPFVCTECYKTFSKSSNMNVHMKTLTGGKPFMCTQCNKTFLQASNLKVHMRIHTGEKPLCAQIVTSHSRTHSNLRCT